MPPSAVSKVSKGVKSTITPAVNTTVVPSSGKGQFIQVSNITPAANAIAGDYVTTFTANAPDSSTSANVDIRVTVETPLNWLIVGAGIIILVLVALGYVFQRYGRR